MISPILALALAAALLPMAAQAADLLQVYEMARNGDPQLSSAESTRLYNKEGQVQARAALLPQLNGTRLAKPHEYRLRRPGRLGEHQDAPLRRRRHPDGVQLVAVRQPARPARHQPRRRLHPGLGQRPT